MTESDSYTVMNVCVEKDIVYTFTKVNNYL